MTTLDARILRRLVALDFNNAAIAELADVSVSTVRTWLDAYGIEPAVGAGKPSQEQRLAAFAAIAGLNNDQDEEFADRVQRALRARLPVDIAYRAARGHELDLGHGVRVLIGPPELQNQAA